MADLGQSTDTSLPNYHPYGIPLQEGFVEVVSSSDPDFPDVESEGKIKLLSWKGPAFIDDPETDFVGVSWILAENWWPYQRPSFITPPFAGYVSGHSTFSRAAAEILTYIMGDSFFPGASLQQRKISFWYLKMGRVKILFCNGLPTETLQINAVYHGYRVDTPSRR